MSINELADAAGLTRRAVRFYVQQGLLPPPLGAGRGSYYEAEHLERLRRILDLQAAGHSLDAIRRILVDGEHPPPHPTPHARRGQAAAKLSAELWTRLRLASGVELHFDATQYNPDVAQLMELREAVRSILKIDADQNAKGAGNGTAK
jgi:DNA-binding transcriptional MerR regulator